MADKQLFDAAFNQFEKASGVVITATTSGAPQTVVTMTTPSLPAGDYSIGYSFQVTHSAKNQPLYFKTGGTFSDAAFFANSASDTDELHVNRFYGFPKTFAGGVITLSLLMYKPTGGATIDFGDVMVSRIG